MWNDRFPTPSAGALRAQLPQGGWTAADFPDAIANAVEPPFRLSDGCDARTCDVVMPGRAA